jgi:hypothetical protein
VISVFTSNLTCRDAFQRRLIDRLIEKLIQISIIDMADHAETEKAPVIRKVLNRVQACPDNTHVRLFFDQTSFLASQFVVIVSSMPSTWRQDSIII